VVKEKGKKKKAWERGKRIISKKIEKRGVGKAKKKSILVKGKGEPPSERV